MTFLDKHIEYLLYYYGTVVPQRKGQSQIYSVRDSIYLSIILWTECDFGIFCHSSLISFELCIREYYIV